MKDTLLTDEQEAAQLVVSNLEVFFSRTASEVSQAVSEYGMSDPAGCVQCHCHSHSMWLTWEDHTGHWCFTLASLGCVQSVA